MDRLTAIFWFAAAVNGVVAAVMLLRRAARPAPQVKEPFLNNSATSVPAAELAYGERASPEL